MELVFSDLTENSDEGSSAKNKVMTIGVDDLIKDIKEMIEDGEDHKEIASYLSDIEKKIESKNLLDLESIDKEHIQKLIEKHPFFKNPNSYHIRLITIMKYLKKKGVDINIPDIDLLVDEIIQRIDGVKKVADGKFSRNK
jgi:prophage maintenance system killer protein